MTIEGVKQQAAEEVPEEGSGLGDPGDPANNAGLSSRCHEVPGALGETRKWVNASSCILLWTPHVMHVTILNL